MTASILFIVDGALDRPLLHSQGLPLLRRMALMGVKCFILSFENSADVMQSELGNDLRVRDIHWEPVVLGDTSIRQRWQMLVRGVCYARRLVKREGIKIIHCRSYRPGLIGAVLKRILGTKFVFDMRGFLIDELTADGAWNTRTVKYKIGKLIERSLILAADALVTTSPQFKEMVYALPYFPPAFADRVVSIPNCVDMRKFSIDNELRQTVRNRFGWQDRYVLLFAGVADRYQRSLQDIFRFFIVIKKLEPRALLVLLAYDDADRLLSSALAEGIGADDVLSAKASPLQMPEYLNGSDAGLAFFRIKSDVHAIASPVKFAEYLACGLPTVINEGVGDTGRILKAYQVGVTVDLDDKNSFDEAAKHILQLSADPDTRLRCHNAAKDELSLDLAVNRYISVYEKISHSHQET